jgi:DNA repair protein RadD
MFDLRGYQERLLADISEAWSRVRAVLAVLPTGAGKTVCFSSVMHDHDGASAAVVHRKEIVGQISLSLAQLGVKHRIIAPPQVVARIRKRHLKKLGKSFIEPRALAGVISVQTLTSKASENDVQLQAWLKQVTLAVFDEGHHYVKSGLWARAVELMHNARLLFVTATPRRADGKGLGVHADGFADEMVEGPPTQWLIEQGYLCGFAYKAPQSDLDVSGLVVTATGDLNTKALRARVVNSHLVGDVVSHYQQHAPGKRAIVFATDVETSREIAAAFNAAGVPAAELNGDTDQGERDHTLDLFEAGSLKVLVNVDLFDEGFDVPGVECVILARPTESLAKYLQMVGRGLRVIYAKGFDLSTAAGRKAAIAASEKPRAIVIDPVRNWERHGLPHWPQRWSLDGQAKGTRASNDELTPTRSCLVCTQPYESFFLRCPHCGAEHVPPERKTPDQVEGNLLDLDVEGTAAMFAAWRAADLPDEDYRLDQIARNIPPVGRSADLKRHQAAKYRRQVLRELVAWWVGMQPKGREMAEVHKRFYYRFHIDIGTAFTLDQHKTDELIETIKHRFTEDLTT